MAACAEAETVLAAGLGGGTDDPRAPDLLCRALTCLPAVAGPRGRVATRADAGYFAPTTRNPGPLKIIYGDAVGSPRYSQIRVRRDGRNVCGVLGYSQRS